MLASPNIEPKRKIATQDAPVYDSFEEMTEVLEYAWYFNNICWCEAVQPIPPATTTVTGVATHYLTTSTVSFDCLTTLKPVYFLIGGKKRKLIGLDNLREHENCTGD